MLLKKLHEYADRLELPPRLYTNAPVRYIIDLNADGNFIELVDTAETDKETKRGVRRNVPEVVRTSGVSAFLLTDKADYVLGLAVDPAKSKRVAECHAAFRDLVERCFAATEDPLVGAVRTFLRAGPLEQVQLPTNFDPSARITFRVGAQFVVDLPAVQDFWADANDTENKSAPEADCLVCALRRRAASTIEKVKGIPGGQMGGTSVVSFNAEAFLSYGLESALNAPVCESCGSRFTKSLNDILANPASHLVVGNAVYAFWTREPSEFDLATLIAKPTAELVKQFLTSPLRGKEGAVNALDPEEMMRFYATVLSASGGRAVVREWIDTSIAEAKTHLVEWFRRQQIVPQYGEYEPLGIRQLAYATVRSGDRNNPPPSDAVRSLLRTALQGDPLPWQLLFEAVRRNRAEQSVTRPRAALIKMVLLSRQPQRGQEDLVTLNKTDTNAAYRCGRLLAVLEAIQEAALPNLNATIVDRFYGTASSAPASVFGRLMRGAQPHLSTLERDRKPAWVALQRQMEDVTLGLEAFPRTLTLEEQGLFALGYYHQRAQRWAGRAKDGAGAADAADGTSTGNE